MNSLRIALAAFFSAALVNFNPAVSFATQVGEVKTPILFNCSVAFTASGRSAYLALGYTNIDGTGTMTCFDYVKNVTEQIPLKIKVKGPGAGLGITGLSISGGQAGIGLNSSPDALLGRYLVVRGNAAVGLGAAASSGIRISNGSFYLTAQLESTSGLGFGVDLLSFEIERDETKVVTTTVTPAEQAVTTPVYANPAVAVSPVSRVRINSVVEVVDDNGKVIGRYQFLRVPGPVSGR